MIQILINGHDVSEQIIFDSLTVTQNLTSAVDTASFSFRKIAGRDTPDFDDDIVILEGTNKIFAGKVVQTTESIAEAMSGMIDVECTDHTLEMDRILVAKTYENMSIKDIIADMVANFSDGFTTDNVTSDFEITKIVFNQVPISSCLKRLADIVSYQWYIDEDKDVHFFDKFTNVAPFELKDDNGNYVYKSLVRSSDGSQVINRVKVRGGEYDGVTFTDTITVSGNNTLTFKLPYRFSNLTIQVDTGAGFVAKQVGIENIDDFTSADVLYNYQAYTIRFQNVLSNGNKIKFSGNPKTPVLAIAEDGESIAKLRQRYFDNYGEVAPAGYGIIEKLVKDNSIASNVVARKRASAELFVYADEVIDATFKTYQSGLRAGMVLNISSDKRDFSDQLIIKKITFSALDPMTFYYKVGCISTQKYTLLDLLRQIIEPAPVDADNSEVSEMAYPLNENMKLKDEWSQINPFVVEEEIKLTELWMKDPFAIGSLAWVYGPHAPDELPIDIASWNESHMNSDSDLYSGDRILIGRPFTFATKSVAHKAQFYLYKTGNPTGNAYAKVYEVVGGAVVGGPVATSDAFDVSTIGAGVWALKDFSFSGINRIDLDPTKIYAVFCNYSGGNSSNRVDVGIDTSNGAVTGGYISSLNGTTFTPLTGINVCFHMFGIQLANSYPDTDQNRQGIYDRDAIYG